MPSQTELLYDLGLDRHVVGITKYCVHPTHWIKEKTIVGGTKFFDFDAIDRLNPDLIVANKEENYKEGIELLQEKYPVWLSDIYNFEDALRMIEDVGAITGHPIQAEALTHAIKDEFKMLPVFKTKRVLYMIWRKPWMVAASNTFIHHMLIRIGLENAVSELERYPELTDVAIREIDPDLILLSSEPFPFKGKHIDELKNLCPRSQVMLVDGEMFSWYGSRLKKAPAYFRSLKLPLA